MNNILFQSFNYQIFDSATIVTFLPVIYCRSLCLNCRASIVDDAMDGDDDLVAFNYVLANVCVDTCGGRGGGGAVL